MAAASRTSTHHESQEVARARDFLARLQGSQQQGNLSGVHEAASGASRPQHPTPVETSLEHPADPTRRSPQNVSSTGWGSVVAFMVEGEQTMAPTGGFSKRRASYSLNWNDEYTGQQGTIASIPACVAKAFGIAPSERRYRSYDELEEALNALMVSTAFERVVQIASARERSGRDCIHKLTDEGFDIPTATAAVQRAERYAIIDNARFAETFIHAKLRSGWGRHRIERALEDQHGICVSALCGYPESFYGDSESEEERARALLAKKAVPIKNPVEKLARFLVGRGFSMGCAYRLAKQRAAEAEAAIEGQGQ